LVEKIAVVVVVAVAAGAALYLFGRTASSRQRLTRSVAAAIAGALAAAGAVYGLEALTGDDTQMVDNAMVEARTLPLVGLVLADVPDAEPRLRASLKEELRNPTTQGAPRPLVLMSELRATHIVPALKAADAADAESVLAARIALMRHLRGTNVQACRELALIGIQHADRLDPQGQQLMRNMLTAMEKAYRSGRMALKPGAAAPPPVPNDTEARGLLVEAGLTTADFEKLQNLAKLSGEEACELGIRLNGTPSRLPPDKAGGLARYLAAAQ
jgi:thioredoxin-like negative regulator of GroEL